MKRLWVLAGLLLLGLAVMSVEAAEEAAPAGEKLFVDLKCNMCHAVPSAGIEAKTKSEKMRGPDLVDLAEHETLGEAKALAGFIKQEVEVDGAKHKKGFKGSDEELAALVDWLLEQKSE